MKPFQFIDPSYPQVWHAAAAGEAPQGYQLLTLAQWLARWVGMMQQGRIGVYLLYSFLTLLATLVMVMR